MSSLRPVLASLRPAQWVKNLLVFAAVVFSQRAGDSESLVAATLAFLLFCLTASGVYLLNDVFDRDADRTHPFKRSRPIASGALTASHAILVAAALLAIALGLAPVLGGSFALTLFAYAALQFVYSLALKRVVILDVFCVAFGFVLRAVAGALAVDVEISPWLLVCSLTLALVLALGKRRHETLLLEVSPREQRAFGLKYSPYFLDQMISVVTASTVVCYALYTLSAETVAKFHTHQLVFTVPFVIYGVFRYLFLVHEKREGGDPTKLFLTDPGILLNTALWLIVSAWILYG